ncbi:ABC transporter permease [Faecalibacillus faecis]|uniref:ABC transporter permease n=1 Tax=Faecalibacillus faecis TaxID=1982628 RepID=UPI00386CD5EB
MIIFSTVFKILNKLKGNLILYTVILLAITLFNTTSGNMNHYEATKPDILIVNRDQNNEITKGFVSYLKEQATLKDIDINDQEKVDDALFYRDVSYVVYIPENFGDDLVNDKNPTIEYKSNGNENSSFTQMLIEKYIKTVNLYKEYYQGKALNQKVKEVINQKTKVKLYTSLDSSKLNQVNVYFNFLNYALLAGGVYCMTMILASLNQEGVRKRTIMSSFSYRKYNWIVFASLGLASFIVWLAYMIISFILFKEIMLSENGIAYILNSFVFSICSLAVGFLIGTITHNKQAIGGIVNVVALGTSFLCGCFVPMSFMPSYVLKIAHILPTYYFVQNNELIKTLEYFKLETLQPIIINGLIVLGFTLSFVLITLMISKRKRKIG